MGIEDEIKIANEGTQDIISQIAGGLCKKVGYNVDIQFGPIRITLNDDKMHADLIVNADVSRDELMKILKDTNLL